MPYRRNKLISLTLCLLLILEQTGLAQTVSLNLSNYLSQAPKPSVSDTFRPLHLRYLSYDNSSNNFQLLLDKGSSPPDSKPALEQVTQELLKYFFIGLALPNDKFWVNLRPDSPDNILDPLLEKTDIGRIFLEADVQLKQDTAGLTSPQTKEGKEYWDKLYKKAGELFGSENITIPTLTRPWIVPDEVILRESPEGAYIYKATLKVMLEEDYLKNSSNSINYSFSDPRLKELNQYSTQLIKESIIPKLTQAVNTTRRYAPLRQVYCSLILAQWFKARYRSPGSQLTVDNSQNPYIKLIDSGNLTWNTPINNSPLITHNFSLLAQQPYDKQSYFQQYQQSFKDGEYNLQEPVYTPVGQSIRRYMSGGISFSSSAIQNATETIVAGPKTSFRRSVLSKILPFIFVSGLYIPSSFGIATTKYEGFYEPHYYVVGGDEGNLKNSIDALAKWKAVPEISDEEWKEIMLRLKNNNKGKDLTRGDVDVTSVSWWLRLKRALSAGKVVLKNVLLLNSRQEAVLYFVEAYDTLGGETIEDRIIIKLPALREQIKVIRKKVVSVEDNDRKLFQKIYATTTERQLALSEILDTIYHEAIHVLTTKDISNGKINREHMEEIFKKYNILQDEKHEVTLELVAYLGQLSSGKFPKRLLWEIFVQSSQNEKYRTCFEIITGELIKGKLGYASGINSEDRRDFIQSLPDESIKSFSARIYYEIMGVNPPARVFLAGLESLLESIVAKYDDNMPMHKETGSSPLVNSSTSPAAESSLGVLENENVSAVSSSIGEFPVINLLMNYLGNGGIKKLVSEGRNISLDQWSIPADILPKVSDIVMWFPSRLARQIEDPLKLKNGRLPYSLGGVACREFVKLDFNKLVSYEQLAHVIWHELIHEFSFLSLREGKPILPLRVWKKIAKEAGFYGAFVGDKLVTVENLPEDYALWEKLGYGDWVYGENGGLYCYVQKERYEELKKAARYDMNGITLKEYNEYWKTTPFESVAEAGAAYLLNSEYANDGVSRFGKIARMVSNTLFAVQEADGSMWKYEFNRKNNKKLMRRMAAEEMSEWKALHGVLMPGVSTSAQQEIYLKPYSQVRLLYKGPMQLTLVPNSSGNEVELGVYSFHDLPARYKNMAGFGKETSFFVVEIGSALAGYKELKSGEALIIGRENAGNFILNGFVSGKHVTITNDGGGYVIFEDQNSLNKTKVVSSGLNSERKSKDLGGIDLSRINKSIRAESVASPGVGGLSGPVDVDFDLNEELSQLQKLLNAEIVPSADRLNRYARVACYSSLFSPDTKDSVLSLVAETFRLQENKAAPAAPELKALAAWLEQGA